MAQLTPPQPTLFAKLISLTVAATALTLAFMFSLVIIPVLLVTGLAAWAYLRWKFRQLQKAMAAQMNDPTFAQNWPGRDGGGETGEVFEGEVVVVREDQEVLLAPRAEDEDNPQGPASDPSQGKR